MIEDIIKELPIEITKEVDDTCSCCGARITKTLRYTLQLKVSRHYSDQNKDRYHAFYLCGKIPCGDDRRYIGNACGLGELSLEKALSNLKTILLCKELMR